jgi:peroxiredoxin
MKYAAFFLFFVLGFLVNVTAQNAYSIKIEVAGYIEKQLYLGYYLGDKQYVRDTALVNPDGSFVFKGKEALPPGMYLVVLAPNNDFFQILVTQKEQTFSVKTTKDKPAENVKFTGSPENNLFLEYINYLSAKRPEAEKIQEEIAKTTDPTAKEAANKKFETLNEEVVKYQAKFAEKNAQMFAGAIVKANINDELPKFEGATEEEKQTKAWLYTRKHYFDNFNISDQRWLRTPFLFQRLDFYVNKLTVQAPDSINVAVDYILGKLRPAPESFKFYLIHYLNNYAASKFVGMDGVYVHIAEKYYASGQADWTDADQLKKIVENAKKLKPLLIGKIAPDIQLEKRDGTPTTLYKTDAEFTVLYFWRYDCGHCKESTPAMKAFYEKFKDRNVKLVAVCVKNAKEIPDCWKFVDEQNIGDWMHTADPYMRYFATYNVETTPQVYILDRKKEIISKQVPADQMESVMEKIIEMNKKVKN